MSPIDTEMASFDQHQPIKNTTSAIMTQAAETEGLVVEKWFKMIKMASMIWYVISPGVTEDPGP